MTLGRGERVGLYGDPMRRILISGCLAGIRVRYDGSARPHPRLTDLVEQAILIPVCPEILGGLGVPRGPCRLVGGDGRDVLKGAAKVIDRYGVDLTVNFRRGAQAVLQIIVMARPDLIIFKERSPSCGLRTVDIGGHMKAGVGVCVAALKRTGVPIISEEDELPWLSDPER